MRSTATTGPMSSIRGPFRASSIRWSSTRPKGSISGTASGKQYIDMASQLVNSNIGHQHPKVVQAIKEQADKLCYIAPSIATESRSTLAALLSTVTMPKINRFFFTNGGAEANENAIKIARFATGRQKIISRYRSYHGATYGAITLTGDPRRPPVEPGIPGCSRSTTPTAIAAHSATYTGSVTSNVRATWKRPFSTRIRRPLPRSSSSRLPGATGSSIPPKEYMTQLRAICDKYGICSSPMRS